MSHVNDSKSAFGSYKDRPAHIGEGQIGWEGFLAFFEYLRSKKFSNFPLILETEHDKVMADVDLLKSLRQEAWKGNKND